MNSLIWLLFGLVIGDSAEQTVQPQTPDQQFEALAGEYEKAHQAFLKANDEAKSKEDSDAIPPFSDRDYSGGFRALAEKYPGTPAAENALIWICSHTFAWRDCEDAKRRVIRDHVRSPKLGPALGFQGHYSDYFEGTEAFFRAVLAENPHHDIQGLASYWLARHLLHKAEGVRAAKSNPNFGIYQGVDHYKDVYGADWAARLRRLDPAALEREAESLFERVARDYADVPHNDKRRNPAPLGELAKFYLHDLRDLAIGKPAPEITGTDLDGRPFRLSEHRGKVVVLDFGSHFYCGACHLTYPHMRALTARLRNRPFAVVSINAEPGKVVQELKEAWAAEGNTWRCLFDGNWEGPIQKVWNIQRFPTIYVLDGKGIIRFKDPQGPELDGQELGKAVDALLEELPRK